MRVRTGLHMIANAIRVLAVVGVWAAAFFDLRSHDYGWAYFDWIQLLIVVACAALAFVLAWIIDGYANKKGAA